MSSDSFSGNGSGNSSNGPKNGPGKGRRNGHLVTGADVLQALLQNSKSQLSDGFLRWRLEQQWPQVVGATIADQTLPCAFERGILHIWVRHSAWMQQLWFFQDAIKDKVNAHLGRDWVRQVRFTLSRRAATTRPGDSGD